LGNLFFNREHSTPTTSSKNKDSIIITLPAHIRTKTTIIADLVALEDKLFFIAYGQYRDQQRKEWKLVRVDFEKSIRQHPSCPQDSRFLVEFFIEHHRDANIDICSQRYWLEYHKSNAHKTLSANYHILQPSQYSLEIAKSKQLVPYREWVNLDDILGVSLHGPFNFATRNNRKTKDRISAADWLALADQSAHYQNQAPKVSSHVIHVDVTQPIFENISTDHEDYTHVKGHQDAGMDSDVPLTREAVLNVECDKLATAALTTASPSPLVQFLLASAVSATVAGQTITRKLPRAIRTIIGCRRQLESFGRRYSWTEAQFDQLDWRLFCACSFQDFLAHESPSRWNHLLGRAEKGYLRLGFLLGPHCTVR
jgi:hypothetical protein